MQTAAHEQSATTPALLQSWPRLKAFEKIAAFEKLGRADAEELFLALRPTQQANLIKHLPLREQKSWLRILHPENAADVIHPVTAMGLTAAHQARSLAHDCTL